MRQIYKMLSIFAIIMATISMATAATESQPDVNSTDSNFLNITDIAGESVDSLHQGEIDIISWSFGVSISNSSSEGVGTAIPNFNDFTIIKKFDKSSPKLFLAELSGQVIPKMVLTVRKSNESYEFLNITFENVLVTKYETYGTENIDQWSFNYEKIQIAYHEQKPDGSPGGTITAGWDLGANKAI